MQLNSKQNFNFIEVTQDVEIWDTQNEIIIDVTEVTTNHEDCCGSYEQNYRIKLNEDLSVELRDELINKWWDRVIAKPLPGERLCNYIDPSNCIRFDVINKVWIKMTKQEIDDANLCAASKPRNSIINDSDNKLNKYFNSKPLVVEEPKIDLPKQSVVGVVGAVGAFVLAIGGIVAVLSTGISMFQRRNRD